MSKSFRLRFFHDGINSIDSSFDYIRLYAVLRTTRDGEVQVRRVADLNTSDVISYCSSHYGKFDFIDNGIIGESIDSTYLYYVGGANIIAGCIAQKD